MQNGNKSSTHPNFGPPCDKSKTCRGFNHQQNLCSSLAPWLPPDLGLMKTSKGLRSGDGMGLMINGRCSSLFFFFFIEDLLFLRSEDLKDPWKLNGKCAISWAITQYILKHHYTTLKKKVTFPRNLPTLDNVFKDLIETQQNFWFHIVLSK